MVGDKLDEPKWRYMDDANGPLLDMLCTLTEEGAQIKVDAVSDENGLEAFRQLCREYDPFGAQN